MKAFSQLGQKRTGLKLQKNQNQQKVLRPDSSDQKNSTGDAPCKLGWIIQDYAFCRRSVGSRTI